MIAQERKGAGFKVDWGEEQEEDKFDEEEFIYHDPTVVDKSDLIL